MSIMKGGVLIAGAGGGSTSVDNSTITLNQSSQIQAVATINANTATGATNPIYDWIGTYAEWAAQSISTTHPEWICYITDDGDTASSTVIKTVAPHNVGDVFYTMRKDTVLNGAVAADGTVYQAADYSGADSVVQLLTDNKLPYVSLSDYATALTNDGTVGVFGWDGQGSTTFRVPTLTDVFIESGTSAQLGDYIAPGLPNITGEFWNKYNNVNIMFGPQSEGSGALKLKATGRYQVCTNSSSYLDNSGSLEFDASRSSAIYGNSATVQPAAVRYRAMIQLATAASDEALVTCSTVSGDVENIKAHAVIDFQTPTSNNNYTWYRKYADGWVEQGGVVTTTNSYEQTIVLPVSMSDAHYTITATGGDTPGGGGYQTVSWRGQTSTQFGVFSAYGGTWYANTIYWRVEGMAAS